MEVLEQQAADDGADGGASGEPGRPDADGGAALVLVGDDQPGADERENN